MTIQMSELKQRIDHAKTQKKLECFRKAEALVNVFDSYMENLGKSGIEDLIVNKNSNPSQKGNFVDFNYTIYSWSCGDPMDKLVLETKVSDKWCNDIINSKLNEAAQRKRNLLHDTGYKLDIPQTIPATISCPIKHWKTVDTSYTIPLRFRYMRDSQT